VTVSSSADAVCLQQLLGGRQSPVLSSLLLISMLEYMSVRLADNTAQPHDRSKSRLFCSRLMMWSDVNRMKRQPSHSGLAQTSQTAVEEKSQLWHDVRISLSPFQSASSLAGTSSLHHYADTATLEHVRCRSSTTKVCRSWQNRRRSARNPEALSLFRSVSVPRCLHQSLLGFFPPARHLPTHAYSTWHFGTQRRRSRFIYGTKS
jgi:hypothetical protein